LDWLPLKSTLALALLSTVVGGCGGGSSTVMQAAPQVADFAVSVSSTSITVAQGAVSAPVTLTVTALNGFSGNVQIALFGLPTGVSSNPTTPFTVTRGANTSVQFGAAANASTGSFTLSAVGTSGSLSHTAKLTLAVQAASCRISPHWIRSNRFGAGCRCFTGNGGGSGYGIRCRAGECPFRRGWHSAGLERTKFCSRYAD
jgi:hypothetical protein